MRVNFYLLNDIINVYYIIICWMFYIGMLFIKMTMTSQCGWAQFVISNCHIEFIKHILRLLHSTRSLTIDRWSHAITRHCDHIYNLIIHVQRSIYVFIFNIYVYNISRSAGRVSQWHCERSRFQVPQLN